MKFVMKKLFDSLVTKNAKQRPEDNSHVMNKILSTIMSSSILMIVGIIVLLGPIIILVMYYLIITPNLDTILFAELKPGSTTSDPWLNEILQNTGKNYTTDCLNNDLKCVNEQEKQFQVEMRYIFDYYKRAYGVNIYTSLTTATVLYDEMDYDEYFRNFDFSSKISWLALNGPVATDLDYNALNAYLHNVSKKQISKIVDRWCVKYDEYGRLIDRFLKDTIDKLDVDEFPERLPYCPAGYVREPEIDYYHDLEKYEKYLKEEFIPENITLPKEEETRNLQINTISDFIFNLSSLARFIVYDTAPSTAFSLYTSNCSNITVADPKNPSKNGTYTLEEYVAGVITNEAGGLSYETLKAQAVAARSFVIAQTNNCQSSVTSTTDSFQSFNPEPTPIAIQAANDTAGQVLTYNNNVIVAYYSAYPRDGMQWAGTNGCSVTCSTDTCTTILYKAPTLAGWEFTMPKTNSNGNYWNDLSLTEQTGHCIGMSQVGAEYLATQGYTYEQILNTFYDTGAGVEISQLNFINKEGLRLTSSGFWTREARPVRDNGFFYSAANTSFDAGFEGECVWYAVGRANEILSSEGINYNWTYARDGGTFCDSSNFDKNHFQVSRDYTQPKEGALVVWKNGSEAGHVAVIESVNADGTVNIGEAGVSFGVTNSSHDFWTSLNTLSLSKKKEERTKNCEGNGSGCFSLATNVSLSSVNHRWGSYEFQCYIYLTDPK